MSSSREENEPGSGEVMKREEEKRMTRTTIGGAIFSRLSRVPFVNIWLRKKIGTARDVVKEETALFNDLVDHDRSFRNLEKIDVLLREDDAAREARATAAENKLAEEKRKAAAREADDRIFAEKKKREEAELDMKNKYDLQILEAGYKIQLDPLKKKVEKLEKPPEPAKKTTTRGRSPKQKRREEVLKRHETEIARINAMNVTATMKATLTKAAETEKEKALEEIEKEP